ncbi:MAG TPA: DUF4450 domain-containing protein, partial [Tepidisphaeraceae bacterium]|nr:DUF4450 domain-containing protein [Tepidisphaeraceae bacterium]
MANIFAFCAIVLVNSICLNARAATPNLAGQIDRPLRYRPENGDFVIVNGPDSFNRSLYGSNTAFRADAGDKPEVSLFLPGRGGTIRFAVKTPSQVKWLHESRKIVARYRPGSMVYEISDPAWNDSILQMTILAIDSVDGVIVKAQFDQSPEQAEFIAAFGAGNGDRGSRNGDIGTERMPVSQFFAFQPEYASNSHYQINGRSFDLVRGALSSTTFPNTDGNSTAAAATTRIAGMFDDGATLAIADGTKWPSAADLLGSAGQQTGSPVVISRAAVKANQPNYAGLQVLASRTATV